MPSIHLTKEEQKKFAPYQAMLPKGWDVQQETLTFDDSREKHAARIRNLHITYKPLLEAMRKAQAIGKTDDLIALSATIDLSKVPESELLELYFAMGPKAFTDVLAMMLAQGLKDEKDMLVFVSDAIIRHKLLESMNLPPRY